MPEEHLLREPESCLSEEPRFETAGMALQMLPCELEELENPRD